MSFMSDFVRNSVRNVNGAEIELEPFIYSDDWRSKPSKFEVMFISASNLYQYGFVISSERVDEEWMFARPASTGRARQLFYRCFDPSTGKYHWQINSAYVKGERGYWRSQTRQDALFLSTAVQFDGGVLKEPYDWLTIKLNFLPRIDLGNKANTAKFLESADKKADFLRLLHHWGGVFLDDIVVYDNDDHVFRDSKEVETLKRGKRKNGMEPTDGKAYSVDFIRKTGDCKQVPLPIEKESRGIQVLFGLICPILGALENGWTVFADDFCNDLHPLALRKLPSMFTDNKLNRTNAQLVFTTHDVSVTDDDSIGNDGIWLLQKKSQLSTEIYPYCQFKGQADGAFSKNYLFGDYGAVPLIVS